MGNQYSTALITAHNKFASALYQTTLAKNKDSNTIFSPISIFLSLLMATSGSNGETLTELGRGLCIDQSPSTVQVFRQIIEPFAADFFSNLNTSILNVANNAFVDKTTVLDQHFKQHIENGFQVQVTHCDFAGNANGEAANINQWVSSKTNQKIQNLIQPNQLNALTKLVLVNAVHFLGQWQNVFDANDSYSSQFYGANGETKCTIMCKRKTKEHYGTEGLYHWVTMAFNDNRYKLTIIAVKDNTHQAGFDEFVSKKLTQGLSGFPTRETQMNSCGFPRFELEQGIELSEILQSAPFNIKKAFSEQADFSSLISNQQVHIDSAIHKAYIKVNEKGAEAGASLGMDFQVLSVVKHPDFLVNSPFAFILTDDTTKTIIFSGKVNTL